MSKIIENLRKKSDHHKKTVVFSVSLAITGIIFVIWLSFIKMEFASIDAPKDVAEGNSPLIFIKESVANAYNGIMSDIKR
ncbi:MAG: hypothetical protein NUV47_03110 [Patescibacteria group bacterium]|nr:hypothetical protein [Patescibacteria group bacterium]